MLITTNKAKLTVKKSIAYLVSSLGRGSIGLADNSYSE
jgi:hypothetical protein